MQDRDVVAAVERDDVCRNASARLQLDSRCPAVLRLHVQPSRSDPTSRPSRFPRHRRRRQCREPERRSAPRAEPLPRARDADPAAQPAAAGPAIVGNGSIRASAFKMLAGGTTSLSRWRSAELCAPRRRSVCPGSSRATAPRTQHDREARERAEDEPACRVERAQLAAADPRAQRRARERSERLEQDRTDGRPGQRGERRVRRARSTLKQRRGEPRAEPGAEHDPGERERGREQSLLPADEGRERHEPERDQVDFRH